MLSPYYRTAVATAALATKVNFTDTATMLTPYLRKGDTATMLSSYYRTATATAALATKVNYTDTSSMLTPYLRKGDTATMLSTYAKTQRLLDTAAAIQTRLALNSPAGADLELQYKSGSSFAASNSFAVVAGAFPRLRINSTNNSGIQLLEGSTPRWSIASYSGGTFTFYNDGINQEALGISGIVATFRSRLLAGGGTDDATNALQVNGSAKITTVAVIGAATAAASAALTVTSTTRGLLPPRMTDAQVRAIASPAAGLLVYNTTLNLICFFNGTTWQRVTSTTM
jgi:hypothetical protein